MAVTDQTPLGGAVGNGVTTVFPFDYYIAADGDLVVLVDAVEASLNVDYTVTGAGNESGGQIVFLAAPTSGAQITHYRDTALERDTDYQTAGDLIAAVLNLDIDRVWLALQEIFSGGKGAPTSIRVPPGETVPALPSAAARANTQLLFDAQGNPYTALPQSTSVAGVLLALAAGAGSSLIGFLQTGVGAVLQTVQAKLRNTVHATDFGVVMDGVTPNAAALQKAIDAVKIKGGTIIIPPGICIIEGSLDLSNSNSVIIKGDGNATAGAVYGSVLRFTAGAGVPRLIDARSSYGFVLEGCYIHQTSAAFTGAVVDLGHSGVATDSAYAIVRENTFALAGTTAKAVDVTKSIIISIEKNQFSGGQRAVYCAAGVGNYANVINILGNTYHAQTAHPLYNGGPASTIWNVTSGNTFEPLADLSAGAMYTEALTGLVFEGNYCGDANTSGDWLVMNGGVAGALIAGNIFAFGARGVRMQGGTANQGIVMHGNTFANVGTADVSIAGGHLAYAEIGPNFHYLSAINLQGVLTGGSFSTSTGTNSRYGSQQFSNVSANGIGTVEAGTLWKIMNSGTANIPFAVQAFAGQAASLTEWRDSANTVVAKIRAAGGMYVQAPEASFYAGYLENTSATSPFGLSLKYSGVTGGAGSQFIVAADNGATRFQVLGNGNAQNANNSYGATSDVKLKQDIVDAGSQWDDIKALRLRNYRFKRDPTGPLQLGLIAQEAELVSPGLIEETADLIFDADGEPTPNGETTKGVKYSVLYLKAVGALQEAMARIEALEAKVNG